MFNTTCHQLGTAPSVIRELHAYGVQQAAVVGADHVFDYSLGNPSIPAPAKVNQAICEILNDTDSIDIHSYSAAEGLVSTRQAIANNLNRRYGTSLRADNFFLTCGTSPALVAVIKALTSSPESTFVVVAPFFPEYRPFVEANGAKLAVVPADTTSFQIQLDELEKLLTPQTQAVIINSPNNPSGVVYTRETLQALAALLTAKGEEFGHPIYIISDDPYRELVYDGVEVPFLPTIYPHTVVCYSYSKSLSLPGERIGYVCVPDSAADSADLYAAVSGAARIIGHICPPTLMQMVVERCADELPDLEAYDANRTLLYDALVEMGYHCAKPDGAFYLFVEAPGGDGTAFSEKAKREQNLLVVPGTSFGCPSHVRISYCVSNEMIRRSLPAFRALIADKQ